jgi:hypothetical protein
MGRSYAGSLRIATSAAEIVALSGAELEVRIHFPPAASLRTFGPSGVGARQMRQRLVYLPA